MIVVPKLAVEISLEALKVAASLEDGEVVAVVEPDGLFQIQQIHLLERSGSKVSIYTAALCGEVEEAVSQAETFCKELSKSTRCTVRVVRG